MAVFKGLKSNKGHIKSKKFFTEYEYNVAIEAKRLFSKKSLYNIEFDYDSNKHMFTKKKVNWVQPYRINTISIPNTQKDEFVTPQIRSWVLQKHTWTHSNTSRYT